MPDVIVDNLDLWASALLTKSTAGRGSNGKLEAYGIKKLRELILELAVRGKLVPQDLSDEPASMLLKRIQTEKTKLIAEGKIKKDKPLPPIADEEKLFDLPNGWAYSNLGDVVEIVRGITFPGNEKSKDPSAGRIACLRTSNVQDQIEWDDILYIREEFVSREDQFLKPRDIVMSMANSRELVGKVALVGEKIIQKTTFGGFLGVLRPFLIDPRFVMSLLRTPHAREMLIDSASQTTNIANVSLAKLRPLFFAIPPLAEQHRIVAKVDELMALCDQLEQQQTHSIETHQTLVETLLGTLTRVESQQEFSVAWARIANHFDTLFTTETSIDQLKQTFLQLAVMGKLVPQDPNDEPASVLLTKIATEKARLIKEGLIRSEKPLIDFQGLDELKRPLPNNWQWARLNDIADIVRGGSPRPAGDPRFYDGEIPFLKVADVSRVSGKLVDGFTYTIKEAGLQKTRFINERTVLLTNSGATLGIPAICDFPTTFNDGIAAFVQLSFGVFDEYLYLYLKSLSQWFLDIASRGQGQPNLNTDIIKATWFALPPLVEQHRIVAKVDELMALCDTLKARLAGAQTIQVHLADAIVEQAVA